MLTENGWPSCDYNGCDTSTVPGTTENIPVQIGIPNTILKAFLADLNAYVEPDNGQGDWGGWTQTNSVATSNHLGGTAVDFNWNDHPMGPAAEDPNAGWQGSSLIDGDEVPAVRDLLNWYEGMVFWGADWDTPKDSMHFQMGYDTYDNIAKCMDFIGRKIRKDMFSVYRRGGTSQNGTVYAPRGQTVPPVVVVTPPAPVNAPAAADVLVAATGVTADLAAQILPAVAAGLIGSQCNTVNRIAMWLAQEGEESAGFTATVEIGNLDGTTYQGRTWEQITGAANYAAFSRWAFANNIPGVSSPTYFVDNPAALGDPQYESLGAVWYWTVARPQINSLCDQGDVQGVTLAINGGLNGIGARTARWNQALAQGDALLTLIQTTGGPFMALSDAEQQEVLDGIRYIRAQIGPTDASWGADSSFGKDASGNELTLRDGLAETKRFIEDPKIAVVTFETTAPPAATK